MTTVPKNERTIFLSALELKNPAERKAYLRKACGEDRALLARVKALLQAEDIKDDFLKAPVLDPDVTIDGVPLTEVPGTVIGRYKLLERIGEGGMATVYMAEQEQPIRRRVALKVIKLGMDTKEVIARFEAERQALAMMDHPNIAKVFDAGATEAGRPYFVMELVRGVSITEYCDKNNLSTQERLELFIPICQAIQHAHQKGIIHRDIKPSNVMVTLHDGRPVPKIIDFGIAKATNQRLTEKTLFTKYAQLIGTPEYMSPEQAEMSGLDIDTRTDIYSLGVLLYELLTGSTPLDGKTLRSKSYAEMQRMIREEEPTKPSTKLSGLGETLAEVAKHRKTSPDLLQKLVRGDLDWIVMKTLEKDRTRRYETTKNLVSDIQCYLNHEPISVGSPGVIYYLKKYLRRHQKRIIAIIVTLASVICIAISLVMYFKGKKERWARMKALPEIVKLIEQEKYLGAYLLAENAEKYIPDDPMLKDLWPKMCVENVSIDTLPPGADLFYKEYSKPNDEWRHLGNSPLENTRFPFGLYRWKIQKDGYELLHAVRLIDYDKDASYQFMLSKIGSIPSEMALIHDVLRGHGLLGPGGAMDISLDEFLIDKYEITNEEFMKFIDEGGYENRNYWEHKFLQKGRELTWNEAMEEFKDSTRYPGPSTWENGTFPAGEERYPVRGISWYEAAAYAKYIGKQLPTVIHWSAAATPLFMSSSQVPLSNFSESPKQVGSFPGMGVNGTYDMAGNVREWCWNATDDSDSQNYILGGACGDPEYMFIIPQSFPPMDRSAKNGFRCMKYLREQNMTEENQQLYTKPIKSIYRNFEEVKPLSDREFDLVCKGHVCYDHDSTLDAQIEKFNEESNLWVKEKVTINAAYDNERMSIYLYILKDKTITKPHQAVIIFPSIEAMGLRSSDNLSPRHFKEFLVKSGRVVVFPVYKGMFERGPISYNLSVNSMPIFHWIRDWMRVVDYLGTRSDIDINRLAFYGFSLGGMTGAYISASDRQYFKACILRGGGIWLYDNPRPERDQINYLPRIKIPVLMVNGRYDFYLPLEESQKPMFELLGTPLEDKYHVVISEAMHTVPERKIEQESMKFLNKYLGNPFNKKHKD